MLHNIQKAAISKEKWWPSALLWDPAATYLSAQCGKVARRCCGSSCLVLPAFCSSASLHPPLAALVAFCFSRFNYPALGTAVCILHHNPGRPASVRPCRPENAPPERFLLRIGLHPSPAKNAARLTVYRPKRKITERKTKRTPFGVLFVLGSGSYLSFRAVASQVLSAYKGLTSVFGMGTGGTP